jgi:hypothetical protein
MRLGTTVGGAENQSKVHRAEVLPAPLFSKANLLSGEERIATQLSVQRIRCEPRDDR